MKNILAASIAVLVVTAAAASAAPFTPGDIVIYQVGNGTGTLSSAAAPVFLDEYSVTGALVQQIAIPTTVSGANFALTDSGSASGDGMITLSGNGASIIITGYNAAVGTASITSVASTQTIGIIGFNGSVDTSTTTTAFSTNNIRSATSVDGSGVWAVGGTGGLVYLPDGGSGAGTVVSSTATNNRVVEVVNGQLYVSSQKTPVGVSTVGTGTPMTTGQAMTILPGQSTGSANETFAFASLNGSSTPNTLYVADTTAGIEKFSLEGSSWIETGSISGTTNIEGLAVSVVNSSTVDIYATSSGSAGTSGTLYGAVDSTGFEGTLSGSLSTLATAPANEAFRGVALAPEQLAVPEPSSAMSIFFGAGMLGFLGRFRRRSRAVSL